MAKELDLIPSLRNDANLQAYYKLEDVNDDLGVNNLTNNNAATFVAAKFNNGVSGGSTDADKALTIASSLGYDGGAYAVSFWLRILTEPATDTAFDIFEVVDSVTDTSLLLNYIDTAGTKTLAFARIRLNVAGDSDSHTVTLGTSVFHHIVLTYDGSTVKGYLDNVEVTSVASTGNGSGTTTTVFVLLCGLNFGTGIGNTLGIIDDFALFDRNLTASEVNRIFTGGFIPRIMLI